MGIRQWHETYIGFALASVRGLREYEREFHKVHADAQLWSIKKAHGLLPDASIEMVREALRNLN